MICVLADQQKDKHINHYQFKIDLWVKTNVVSLSKRAGVANLFPSWWNI